MKIFAETDRFLLREITADDSQGFYELDSDPEVHKYLGNHPIQSLEECHQIIKHIRKQYKEIGLGRWAIIDKASEEFVGWTGLKYEQNIRSYPYYDLGYRILRKHWGKGIATETAIASLDYGFNELNLDSISAAAHEQNGASNHILKKIGFEFIEKFHFDGSLINWYTLENNKWK